MPSPSHTLWVTVLLLCSGCATYAERTLKLRNAYYDNQIPIAETAAADQRGGPADERAGLSECGKGEPG